jgi:hypothetical protein
MILLASKMISKNNYPYRAQTVASGPEFIVYSKVKYALHCLEIHQVHINEMHYVEYLLYRN